ncbi:cytidylyltransferase domain-containing protein [Metabacillus sp. HB246100]
MSIVAIIPARGGSKGLPKKNIKILAGKPLIAHTIDVAIKCKYIDRVLVSTDDIEIANISKAYGAEVPFLRPENLATDEATTIDVLRHAIEFLEDNMTDIKHVVLLQPTSPLRSVEDLNHALEKYTKKSDGVALISVCEAQSHPYLLKTIDCDMLIDFVDKQQTVTRRQDLPIVYEINGGIYVCPKENILKGYIYTDPATPFIMNKENSVDIDDEVDFLLAEAILKKRSESDV